VYLFKLVKYKIVVFDEVCILFHFNIILNTTEYPLLSLHNLTIHTSGLISLYDKIQPPVTLACVGRNYKSEQYANWCARWSVCFCRQVEAPVFVCLLSNC